MIKEKVHDFIQKHCLLSDGAKVVVGVSGGPDSVCLVRILRSLGYRIVAVHCNFHLRGEESMRDEEFTRSLCEELGVELLKVDFDTEVWAKEHGVSIEMAARELRYDFFRKVMREHGCEAIAVGHHEDDNVETMILNMARGAGIQGMCGIQPKNGEIVRPLLCVTREDIIHYLYNVKQEYVTDSTNLEDEFSRNKVRLDIVPMLREINSGASHNISVTMENLNEVRKVYQQAIRESVGRCCEKCENGEMRIDINMLSREASPSSVLHEILSPLGFNRSQIGSIADNLGKSGSIYTGKNERRVLIDRKHIVLEADYYPAPQLTFKEMAACDVKIEKSSSVAYIDADKVRGKLTVRTPKQGDSFAPFGMKGKRKLISDFLTDIKMSRFSKEHQALLCDEEDVVWVVGLRSSERYRIDEGTRRVIVVRV